MTDQSAIVPALGQALAARGYDQLTPVQSAMLDPEIAASDLLVSAQTGSGKTVAFGIAMAPSLLMGADRLPRPGTPLALVVAPTRELAVQVHRELDWLYAEAGARVVSCVGGMDPREERSDLMKGAHIVVGTPGRLVDHLNRGSLVLDDIRVVAMDEADEMLDLGFREELETLLSAAPEDRRTLLFSATVSKPIARLAETFQRDAVRINTISDTDQHADIDYRAHSIAPSDVENAIINVLRFHEAKNALVFCKTRANVNHLLARFHNRGLSVVALSGELSQSERTHALQALRDGRANVCVATDVAARGLDLPDLDLVIHADLPTNREALLHRSGRTGRAGRKGVSVLIVPFKARRRIERLLQDARVEASWTDAPGADDIRKRDDERLLNHPSLTETASTSDHEMARMLIDIHGAEQVAAAFVAHHRARRSAPEELMDVPEYRPADKRERPPRGDGPRGDGPRRERTERREPRAERNDFEDSVWINLSVGRKSGADPRWLLPMLCKAGGLHRTDVGAIRIEDAHTRVELKAESAPGFLERVGPDGRLEKSISAWREGEKPAGWTEGSAPARRERRDDRDSDRTAKKRSGPPSGPRSDKRPGKFAGKPRAEGKPRFEGKPRSEGKPARKPRPVPPSQLEDRAPERPKSKKPGKPKPRRFDPTAEKPPKRRKPKQD
jgi:ATP-dependent RNA helicase DeaD